MYKKIRSLKETLADGFAERLIDEGVIDSEGVEKIKKEINDHFDSEFEKAKNFKPSI